MSCIIYKRIFCFRPALMNIFGYHSIFMILSTLRDHLKGRHSQLLPISHASFTVQMVWSVITYLELTWYITRWNICLRKYYRIIRKFIFLQRAAHSLKSLCVIYFPYAYAWCFCGKLRNQTFFLQQTTLTKQKWKFNKQTN